jgi:hypothetical protein
VVQIDEFDEVDTPDGVSVTIGDTELSCASTSCEFTADDGDTVTVNNPPPDYTISWIDGPCDGSGDSCTFTADSDVTLTLTLVLTESGGGSGGGSGG